jgi:hypothetical protein
VTGRPIEASSGPRNQTPDVSRLLRGVKPKLPNVVQDADSSRTISKATVRHQVDCPEELLCSQVIFV